MQVGHSAGPATGDGQSRRRRPRGALDFDEHKTFARNYREALRRRRDTDLEETSRIFTRLSRLTLLGFLILAGTVIGGLVLEDYLQMRATQRAMAASGAKSAEFLAGHYRRTATRPGWTLDGIESSAAGARVRFSVGGAGGALPLSISGVEFRREVIGRACPPLDSPVWAPLAPSQGIVIVADIENGGLGRVSCRPFLSENPGDRLTEAEIDAALSLAPDPELSGAQGLPILR